MDEQTKDGKNPQRIRQQRQHRRSDRGTGEGSASALRRLRRQEKAKAVIYGDLTDERPSSS